MSRLVVLYPAAWRDRYGTELLALLSERPPNLLDRVDLVRGAMDARLHPELTAIGPGSRASGRAGRHSALLAIPGGLLWIAASVGFYGAPLIPALGYKDSGSLLLLAVLGGLLSSLASLGMARVWPGRPAVLVNTAIAGLFGAVLLATPWPWLAAGFYIVLIATMLFGAMVARGIGWPGLILVICAIVAAGFNTETAQALLLIPLGVAWILFGLRVGLRGVPVDLQQHQSAAPQAPAAPS
jgi:hypothetical protein